MYESNIGQLLDSVETNNHVFSIIVNKIFLLNFLKALNHHLDYDKLTASQSTSDLLQPLTPSRNMVYINGFGKNQ